MALPIKPTPQLNKDASERFLTMVEEGLKVPTDRRANKDKLRQARDFIHNHAILGPKKD